MYGPLQALDQWVVISGIQTVVAVRMFVQPIAFMPGMLGFCLGLRAKIFGLGLEAHSFGLGLALPLKAKPSKALALALILS